MSHSPWRGLVLAAGIAALIAIGLTAPETTADAPEYARDVVDAGVQGQASLIEPGHLLWRPLGYGINAAAGLPEAASRAEAIRVTQRRLTTLATIAGVATSILMALVTMQMAGSAAAGLVGVVLLVTSSTFLSYSQAGTSYIPALALMLVGAWLGWRTPTGNALLRGTLAGASLALAVLMWLPFVLVVPAALLGILLGGREHAPGSARARAVAAIAACAVVGIGAYASAAARVGVRSISQFTEWVGGASHGVTTGGLARVLIGMPRSFLFMGHDGREVKRYLLHDALNPVGAVELLRLGLWWKMGLFYAAMALMLWVALRTPRLRAPLALLAAAAIPVLVLATAWMGGDLERYLPLYPFLLPVLAASVTATWERPGRRLPRMLFGALAVVWCTNVWRLGPVPSRQRAVEMAARIGCADSLLNDASIVVVPHHGDPLYLFARNELDAVPRRTGAEVITFVRPGAPDVAGWQDSLDSRLRASFARGTPVWVPDYVREDVPPRGMGWVEGVDRRVAWSDVRAAWSRYALRRECTEGGQLLRVQPHDASSP